MGNLSTFRPVRYLMVDHRFDRFDHVTKRLSMFDVKCYIGKRSFKESKKVDCTPIMIESLQRTIVDIIHLSRGWLPLTTSRIACLTPYCSQDKSDHRQLEHFHHLSQEEAQIAL